MVNRNEIGLDIAKLQRQAYETHKAKGWEDRYERNPDGTLTARQLLELVCLVTDELDEADLESGPNFFYVDHDGKPCGVAVEVVDAIIRTLNIISSCGLAAEMTWVHALGCKTQRARHTLVKSIRHGRPLEEIGTNLNVLLSELFERLICYRPENATIADVFKSKMAYNATRPNRHGGQLA